jgi:hypothetical protein
MVCKRHGKSLQATKQTEVIQNYENEHVRGIGQGEARQKT